MSSTILQWEYGNLLKLYQFSSPTNRPPLAYSFKIVLFFKFFAYIKIVQIIPFVAIFTQIDDNVLRFLD